jgi:hypothetical protein
MLWMSAKSCTKLGNLPAAMASPAMATKRLKALSARASKPGSLAAASAAPSSLPLSYEQRVWAASPHALLCGVDEAGRGPLAGPVAVAAVILDPARLPRGLAPRRAPLATLGPSDCGACAGLCGARACGGSDTCYTQCACE